MEGAIWASRLTHHGAQLEAPGKPKSVQAKASFRKLSVLSVKTSDSRKSFHSPHKQLVLNAKYYNFTFLCELPQFHLSNPVLVFSQEFVVESLPHLVLKDQVP